MYKILEHTADLRMKIAGQTPIRLFSEALAGMMNFLKKNPEKTTANRVKRFIKISSVDLTALLIDFLNEALALSSTHKEIYDKAIFNKFSDNSLEAEVEGFAIDSFDKDIKAATYHEADVKQNKKGEWETVIVFDV